MVRRLAARREPDRAGRRSPRPCRPAATPAGRRPRSRPSRRAARRSPAPCRRTRRADGTRRPGCPPPSPARGPRHRGRRRCGPSPGRRTAGARRPAARWRRPGRPGSPAPPRRGSAPARRRPGRRRPASGTARAGLGVATGDGDDRPARAMQGHAERGPDRAGADDADERRLARARVPVRMGVRRRARRRRGGGGRGGRVEVDARPRRWSPPSRRSRSRVVAGEAAPGLHRGGPARVGEGRRGAPIECSERPAVRACRTGESRGEAGYTEATSTRGGRTRPAPTDPALSRGR